MLTIPDLLPPEVLAEIRQAVDSAEFIEGRGTASRFLQQVKHNLKLPLDREPGKQLSAKILSIVKPRNEFTNVFFAKRFSSLLFSRTETGMTYGDHVDNPLMAHGSMRADLSMTIFLSEPDEYGGGELVVDTDGIPKTAKLPAGHAVIYSTYSLHRVNPVTSGVRYAAIGWMESHIRLPMHRDLLTDLLLCMDLVTSSPPRGLGLSGDALIYQRVQKVRSNLIRLWAESG